MEFWFLVALLAFVILLIIFLEVRFPMDGCGYGKSKDHYGKRGKYKYDDGQWF